MIGGSTRNESNVGIICIKSAFFTVKLFNHCLVNFDYGYSEVGDKPAEIDEAALKKTDGRIRQSASQMWLLLSILPFIVADLIPQENSHGIASFYLSNMCIMAN